MQQPAVRQQQICPAEQHWLPQQLWPLPQLVPLQGAAVQPVPEQYGVFPSQTVPHAPQFLGSFHVSTHCEPQQSGVIDGQGSAHMLAPPSPPLPEVAPAPACPPSPEVAPEPA
jgi:hypothetical protein